MASVNHAYGRADSGRVQRALTPKQMVEAMTGKALRTKPWR
jgi:hypothetical protein